MRTRPTSPLLPPGLVLLALLLAILARPAGAADGAPPPVPAPVPEGTKRIGYVPENVKAQIREEVKQEVLEQIRAEPWATQAAVPDWTRRITIFGDVRVRYEYVSFGLGNANGGEFPDFNAINSGKPFDVNFVDVANERYLDVDQNRSRFRLRARVGATADLGQGFTIGVRIASGDGTTPVSTNQTLGGSGGFFSKYSIWLDQAYLRWEPSLGPGGGVAVEAGRFENPFFTVRDLLWSENVNFDGFAVAGDMNVGGGFQPFLVAGAFPIFSTAFNFPIDHAAKYPSLNKWLFAGQLGTGWKIGAGLGLKLGVAYYAFQDVKGRASSLCDTNLSYVTCDTDDTRPAFAQKGNTYMVLRTPSAAALQAEATNPLTPRYQYFGLASDFQDLVATGLFRFAVAPGVIGTLEGEFAWNVAFSQGAAGAVAVNNLDACDAAGSCTGYAGGGKAWVGRLGFGSPTLDSQWDWNVAATYMHVESDAVLDAFTNPDFGLGGTNLKGYWIGGRVALAKNVATGARWMSADNIVGPTYRVDVFQVDVWGRF
jgi:hypothetical protein